MKLKIFKTLSLTISLSSLSLLSGCAMFNKDFQCNAMDGEGIGCASMSQVNDEVNTGRISPKMGSYYALPDSEKDNLKDPNQPQEVTTVSMSKSIGYGAAFPQAGQPIRYGESVQRVWFGPWEDETTNYHDPSTIYFITEGGHWIGAPVKEIKSDEITL